ncbi:hypothetical protein AWC22_23260 [Mycobacterium riyadhense]|uniref:Mrr-like domain-containing protein n=1 Tax=Mycobacterium riyadhense TaxID=486698 RepID=A0A1X2CEE9_9MYCO|nr:hypothetical protein [Mycobacterium riyadhense]ORW74316.1 hypothetical protein AWC22_23260 [Mycobacterium riyadhense]
MGSVHEVIEAFRKAPSNSERGTKFEELMVRYFELDPMMSQQYDAVWRWIDWPGRQGKPDTGIDLMARERDTGNYTAIQCKHIMVRNRNHGIERSTATVNRAIQVSSLASIKPWRG